MKKSILFLLCVLLFGIVSAASADQWGDELYGFSDQYGVYVHGLDGESIYIWFWSEWARQSIMGDLTAPGDHVMERPASASDGKFNLGFVIPEAKAEPKEDAAPVPPQPQPTTAPKGTATPAPKVTDTPTTTTPTPSFMAECTCRTGGWDAETQSTTVPSCDGVTDTWCASFCKDNFAGRYADGYTGLCMPIF